MPSQLQKVAQKEAQDHEAVDDGAPVCLHEGEVHAVVVGPELVGVEEEVVVRDVDGRDGGRADDRGPADDGGHPDVAHPQQEFLRVEVQDPENERHERKKLLFC